MSKFKKVVTVIMCAVMITCALTGCFKKVKCYENTPVPDFLAALELDESHEFDLLGETLSEGEIAVFQTELQRRYGNNLTFHFYQDTDMDMYIDYVKVIINEGFEPLKMPDTENAYYAKNDETGLFLLIISTAYIDSEGVICIYPFKMSDEKMDDESYENFLSLLSMY